jgi:hypothetical protein
MEVARSKRRTVGSEEVAEGRRKLDAWATANPRRPASHVVRAEHVDHPNKLVILTFAIVWAAKKCVDQLLEGEEYRWLDKHTIMTPSGKKIKSEQLEEIIEYDYSKEEQEWDFPPSDTKLAIQLFLAKPKTQEERAAEIKERNERLGLTGTSVEVKAPRVKKEKVPRASREGLTSVADICEEIGMDPPDARAILRKKKIEKPAQGWVGDENWAREIRKVLEANIK